MTRPRYAAAAAALILTLATGLAQAETPTVPTVTATGQATLKHLPTILRIEVVVTAQGADAKDALAKLKTAREAANAKLTTLKADPNSITFADPTVFTGPATSLMQRQMQMAMAMGRNGRKPATSQPQGVTVSTTLTAEWSLPADTADANLVAATDLQAKVKAAFPVGGAAGASGKPASPEEQEILEEMSHSDDSSGQQSKPGEPTFVFVYRLTDAEEAKLLADAVATSRARATALATAAGISIIKPHQLSVKTSAAEGATSDDDNPYSQYIRAMTGSTATPAAGPREATSPTPGPVTYTVTVTAAFAVN